MIQKQSLLLAFIIMQSLNVVASASDSETIYLVDPDIERNKTISSIDPIAQTTGLMFHYLKKTYYGSQDHFISPDHSCFKTYFDISHYRINRYTESAFIDLYNHFLKLAKLPYSNNRTTRLRTLLTNLSDEQWDDNVKFEEALKESSTPEQSSLYTKIFRMKLVSEAWILVGKGEYADSFARQVLQMTDAFDASILTARGTNILADIVNETTYNLGLMHIISERYGTAHALLEKSLKAGHIQSGREIAQLFLMQGNLDGALDYTKRYERNFAEKINTIGFILEQKGDAVDAAIHYNKAAVHGHVYAQLNLVYLYAFYPDLVKEIAGTVQLKEYATRAIDSRDPEIATIQYYSTHWSERYAILASQQLIDDILSQCEQTPTKDLMQDVTDSEDDTDEEYDPAKAYASGPDKGKGKAEE